MPKMSTYERAIQIYQILNGAAHNRQVLTYEILGKMVGVPARGLAPHLDHLMRYCDRAGLPPLTVLAVQKEPPDCLIICKRKGFQCPLWREPVPEMNA